MKTFLFYTGLIVLVLSCTNNKGQYLVILNRNPDRTEISSDSAQKVQDAHMKNIRRLAADGILAAAGPFEGGGGLFIINAGNKAEAEMILTSDPAIKAGHFLTDVYPLIIERGMICPPVEEVNMETFRFNHFIWNGQFTKEKEDLLDREIDSLKGEIILKAALGKSKGKILIYKPVNNTAFRTDIYSFRGLEQEDYILDEKFLWIARESFCR